MTGLRSLTIKLTGYVSSAINSFIMQIVLQKLWVKSAQCQTVTSILPFWNNFYAEASMRPLELFAIQQRQSLRRSQEAYYAHTLPDRHPIQLRAVYVVVIT